MPAPSAAFARAVWALAMDQVTVEIVPALRAKGIEPILLKGPAIAQWLYPEGGRAYGDSDLLVAPSDFSATARLLRELGFREVWRRRAPTHARTFSRPSQGGRPPATVDLHYTLQYVHARPEAVWGALSGRTVELMVGGVSVRVLDVPARSFHVAQHAVQHGDQVGKPLEDLRRAIRLVSVDSWREAASIARSLGSHDILATALGMVPEGAELAAELDLPGDVRTSVWLSAHASTRSALTLQRLAETRSPRQAALIMLDSLVPLVGSMRQSSPLAAHSTAGLALAYVLRPPVMLWRAGKGAASRRRLGNRSRESAVPRASAARPGTAERPTLGDVVQAARWTFIAAQASRKQLRTRAVAEVELPSSAGVSPNASGAVRKLVDLLPLRCLARSLVVQAWRADHGDPVDLVIGVRAPSAGFAAHAWLADEDQPGRDGNGFTAIQRVGPRARPEARAR